MGHWRDIFSTNTSDQMRHRLHVERRRLLPTYDTEETPEPLSSKEVTKVALRLKYQVERVVPCELAEDELTNPNSRVITKDVVKTAKGAASGDFRGCVVFALLVCLRWFKIQATVELWDSDLFEARAVACEVIAKHIIETEEDQSFLLRESLLKRYSFYADGGESSPANVIERAVDLRALRVIGCSGYQKCIKYLWNGWYCQEEGNPSNFVEYNARDDTRFSTHFHPDRMRAPIYQNVCQIMFSLVYLVLYSAVINTINPTGDLDIAEGILYIMTLAFICDELVKLWKIGKHYFDFWNAFNSTLYTILAISFFLRVAALSHSSSVQDEQRQELNRLSYNFVALAGPMFWMRMMLYLDSIRFFGAMFVVLRVMMKESLIFFALLFVVLVGFFQAFMGMAQVDSDVPVTGNIIQGMANTIMQSPEFETFQDFAFPFGIILYYLFNFIIMIVLLNILIALYNSAYEDISGNAIDEYMAVFALKTMQFVRAPDENVFIPPFNLLEIVFLVLPFEWWLPSHYYAKINDIVMTVIYSPLLLIVAFLETRDARRIRWNRGRGEEDDDDVQEWEHVVEEVDFDLDDAWRESVRESTPNINVDRACQEIMQLQQQVNELTEIVKQLSDEKIGGSFGGNGESSNARSDTQ